MSGTSCNDGQFCTATDTCDGSGTCVGTGDPCTGGPECNNVCNEGADNCAVSAGTACTDDGSVCTNDECNGSGACGHPNNTAACDDGVFCNGTDTCGGGTCGHSGDPCTSGQCNETSDQCVAATGCPLAPQQTCRTAAKSILVAKDNSDDTKDRLVWKWIRGAATTLGEFGDPTATAVYKLCLYTGTPGEFVDEAIVPAGGSRWRLAGTTKYLYTDSAATADGIKKVLLKSGEADKARALVKGKGAALPDLVPPVADPPVVTVKLLNGGNGICWGASYSGAQVLKNQEGMLKAKAP